MQKRLLLITFILVSICCFTCTKSAGARGMPPVNLNLIPTAETLGSGGYSLSVGMFPHDETQKTVNPMDVDVGGFFKEKHEVAIDSDIWLIPTRITYGISDRLDFTFGGTYGMGDTDKIIFDYYEIGDNDKERVYSQVVLDGLMGAKYKIQEASPKLPALAVGGEVQMGYTVDDEFVDDTPGDSFPFLAMQIYMSASYDFEIANVHGGLGMFVSSKSIESSKRFDVPVQLGAEIPFDGFAALLDITLFNAFSGIGFDNVVSAGLRYNISSRASINATVASAGGFMVRLTVGGKKPVTIAPPSAPTLF
jgi:hypothetical protein